VIGYLVATVILLVINWRVFFEDRTTAVRVNKAWKEAKL
jgi:hypothetical protein